MKYLAAFTLFVAVAAAVPLSVDAKVEIGTPGVKVVKGGNDNNNNNNNGGNNSGTNRLDLLGLGGETTSPVCTGTYKAARCCSTSVQGIANLDCIRPEGDVSTLTSFEAVCRTKTRRAMCCGLPVAGQALLCVEASTNQ